MASPLISRVPQCSACIRRLSSSWGTSYTPARQQIRGKKTLASDKITTVSVELLQNVPGYGRRGAVIPVTAGVMRNIWYPKKMARYVTVTRIKELGLQKNALPERDPFFKSSSERKTERAEALQEKEEQAKLDAIRPVPVAPTFESSNTQREGEAVPQIHLELMSPERATSILESLIPANLDFYRTTVTVPPQKKISPSISSSAAMVAAAEKAKVESNKIHGSVSTNDIVANLKAILAEDEEGARVILSPEDVSFVDETEDKDRVKQLGVFEIEIRLDRAPDSVRRTIKVSSQS